MFMNLSYLYLLGYIFLFYQNFKTISNFKGDLIQGNDHCEYWYEEMITAAVNTWHDLRGIPAAQCTIVLCMRVIILKGYWYPYIGRLVERFPHTSVCVCMQPLCNLMHIARLFSVTRFLSYNVAFLVPNKSHKNSFPDVCMWPKQWQITEIFMQLYRKIVWWN